MKTASLPVTSGIFRTLILWLLMVPVLIHPEVVEKGYDYRIGELDSSHIPKYERVPVLRNYLINQTWISVLRGGIIGSGVGRAVGGILDLACPRKYMYVSQPVIGSIAGVSIGGGVGMSVGIVKGAIFNKKATRTPQFHARRMRIGLINPLILGSARRIKDVHDFGGCISYKTRAEYPWIPDQLRLLYWSEFWSPSYSGPDMSESDLVTSGTADCVLRRVESALLYDGPAWTIFVPYAGLAAGYCWGDLELICSIKDPEGDPYRNEYFRKTEEIRIPSIRVLTGLRLDLFDLAFAEAEFSYEPVGPYLQLRKHIDLSYANNFTFGFAFGAFIF